MPRCAGVYPTLDNCCLRHLAGGLLNRVSSQPPYPIHHMVTNPWLPYPTNHMVTNPWLTHPILIDMHTGVRPAVAFPMEPLTCAHMQQAVAQPPPPMNQARPGSLCVQRYPAGYQSPLRSCVPYPCALYTAHRTFCFALRAHRPRQPCGPLPE